MGTMNDRLTGCLGLLGAALLVGASAGCGGAGSTTGGAKAPGVGHADRPSHEACGSGQGSVESVDANGDGKPDIERVSDHGREVCRSVDLDHDGKPDLYEYFNTAGQIRRREFCYDQTGAVNAIEIYEGGRLAQREYDIGGQHKIDTWDWFDPNGPVDPTTGRPVHPIRRERDTKGSGQVDQWWTWNGDQVTIAFDKTGDGRPDPATAVVLGPDGNPVSPPSSGSNQGAAALDAGPGSSPLPAPDGGGS